MMNKFTGAIEMNKQHVVTVKLRYIRIYTRKNSLQELTSFFQRIL